ncbi:hypothetical protein Pmar_PMAR017494, partial [Perkinsus marinus ATCC 50983]
YRVEFSPGSNVRGVTRATLHINSVINTAFWDDTRVLNNHNRTAILTTEGPVDNQIDIEQPE